MSSREKKMVSQADARAFFAHPGHSNCRLQSNPNTARVALRATLGG
jgi:hypothetical protein